MALRLLTCLSLSLGQSEQFLGDKHKGMLIVDQDCPTNATTLRSIHYPPIGDEMRKRPGIVRCGEHSDYGTITLLYQVTLIFCMKFFQSQ